MGLQGDQFGLETCPLEDGKYDTTNAVVIAWHANGGKPGADGGRIGHVQVKYGVNWESKPSQLYWVRALLTSLLLLTNKCLGHYSW